jgi:putative DNA primase/helicase
VRAIPQAVARYRRREPAASGDDLLERAFAAKNGDKLRRLFNGDTSGYDSGSEAALALCALLSFWTGPDPATIDSCFAARRS